MKKPNEVWIREQGCIAWTTEQAIEQLRQDQEEGISEPAMGPFRLYRLVEGATLSMDLPPHGAIAEKQKQQQKQNI